MLLQNRKPKGRGEGEGKGRGRGGEGRGGEGRGGGRGGCHIRKKKSCILNIFAKETGPHRLLSGNQREEGRKQMGTVRVGAKVREPQRPREPHE